MRGWGISLVILGVLSLIGPRFGFGVIPFVFFGEYYTETSIACVVVGAVLFLVGFARGQPQRPAA